MEELDKALDDIISYIKSTKDYQECLKIKEQMSSNKELCELIEKVKLLQKNYVKSNYDSNIKEELDILEERLTAIPIYNIYEQRLNKVNGYIEMINDNLNDYFYRLLNEKGAN